jgi:glycosyltransferase involved in cell wall biosynthesis
MRPLGADCEVTTAMRILMVGHSYVVALNRRLCREVARAGGDHLAVTVAAPSAYPGDLRPIVLEPLAGEPYALEPVPVRMASLKVPHVFQYGRRLGRLLADSWDVVHAWEEPFIVAGWQIARGTRPGVTLVFSSFQNQPKRYPPPFSWFERASMARASGWTAFGQTVAENLKTRAGYSDKPWRMIPLGVDLDVFRPEATAGRQILGTLGWSEPGPPVVGYLGRFVPEKGLRLLMNALDLLPPGSWRSLWIGGGLLEEELQAWAAKHPGHTRIVTKVPHDKVPAYLNAMDLLAAPSQTTPKWREQFGRMLIEAMGCGVPVIGSDSGEIPYVIANAGRVLPEADTAAWVAALAELLESPAQRRELGERGLARAQEVYAWPLVGRKYLGFFTELRDLKAGRRPFTATGRGFFQSN